MTDSNFSAIRARLRYASIEEFIEGYSKFISAGGMFIPMAPAKLKPVGTTIRFQFLLGDGSTALLGESVVVQVRPPDEDNPKAPVGMLVKFSKLSQDSKQVVDRVVEAKQADEAEPEPTSAAQAEPGAEDEDRTYEMSLQDFMSMEEDRAAEEFASREEGEEPPAAADATLHDTPTTEAPATDDQETAEQPDLAEDVEDLGRAGPRKLGQTEGGLQILAFDEVSDEEASQFDFDLGAEESDIDHMFEGLFGGGGDDDDVFGDVFGGGGEPEVGAQSSVEFDVPDELDEEGDEEIEEAAAEPALEEVEESAPEELEEVEEPEPEFEEDLDELEEEEEEEPELEVAEAPDIEDEDAELEEEFVEESAPEEVDESEEELDLEVAEEPEPVEEEDVEEEFEEAFEEPEELETEEDVADEEELEDEMEERVAMVTMPGDEDEELEEEFAYDEEPSEPDEIVEEEYEEPEEEAEFVEEAEEEFFDEEAAAVEPDLEPDELDEEGVDDALDELPEPEPERVSLDEESSEAALVLESDAVEIVEDSDVEELVDEDEELAEESDPGEGLQVEDSGPSELENLLGNFESEPDHDLSSLNLASDPHIEIPDAPEPEPEDEDEESLEALLAAANKEIEEKHGHEAEDSGKDILDDLLGEDANLPPPPDEAPVFEQPTAPKKKKGFLSKLFGKD